MSDSIKISHSDVIIVGGGCAGLTAALYCARAGLQPLVFVGQYQDKGGLLVKTTVVENYPGFVDGIMGVDLVMQMEQQAVKHGAIIVNSEITHINVVKYGTMQNNRFFLDTDNNQRYTCIALILATGSTPNKLLIPKEDIYWGKGISSCAVCDGALYKNKKIVVIGGGDTAMEEALFLTKFSHVTLIHRRDKFRASDVMQKRVLNNSKITILYDTVVDTLIGNDEQLTHIECKNVHTGDITTLEVQGLFYGLGLTPNTKLAQQLGVKIENGHAVQIHNTETSVQGVFVSGDVTDNRYRQAIVACGDGCKAAMDVMEYISINY